MPNRATQEITEFTRDFLQSETYRRSATRRILAGQAPQLEILLHRYAFGTPNAPEPSGPNRAPIPCGTVVFYNPREFETVEGKLVERMKPQAVENAATQSPPQALEENAIREGQGTTA